MDPAPPSTPPIAPSVIPDDRPCLSCGYNLRGLPYSDNCPECGRAVAGSLRGNLLVYSTRDYVALLYRGVVFIQTAIVGEFLVVIGLFLFPVFGLALSPGSSPPAFIVAAVPSIMTGVMAALSLLSIAGWWMFSWPDPALGDRDEGTTARRVVRATIIIQAISSVASVVTSQRGAPRAGPAGVFDVLGAMIGIAAAVALVVWFFAAMVYVRQLAPRLPDEHVRRRAKLYMWLLPVIAAVGAPICGLGPLIALVMYYNLLDQTRKDLRRIRTDQFALAAEPIVPPPL